MACGPFVFALLLAWLLNVGHSFEIIGGTTTWLALADTDSL